MLRLVKGTLYVKQGVASWTLQTIILESSWSVNFTVLQQVGGCSKGSVMDNGWCTDSER
jgi:hypothetical protein